MACRPESSSCWAVRRTAIATECRSWRAKGPLTGAPFCAPRHQPPHTFQLTASRTSAPVLSGALRCVPGLSGAFRSGPGVAGALRCTPATPGRASPELSDAVRRGPALSGPRRGVPARSAPLRGVPRRSGVRRCAPVLFSVEPPRPRNRAQFRLNRTVSAIACAPNRRGFLPNFADGLPSISGNSVRDFGKRRPPSRSAPPVTPPRPPPSRPPVIDAFFHPTRKPAVPTGHESPWETSVTGGQWHPTPTGRETGDGAPQGTHGATLRKMKDRVACPRRDADGRGGLPGHDRSIPFASETSKSGCRDVKGGVAPKPTPRGEEAGTTTACRAARRTDRAARRAHAEPPCASPPRPLSSPSPKNSSSSPFSLLRLSVLDNLRPKVDAPFSSHHPHRPPPSPLHASRGVSSFRGIPPVYSWVPRPRFLETAAFTDPLS